VEEETDFVVPFDFPNIGKNRKSLIDGFNDKSFLSRIE